MQMIGRLLYARLCPDWWVRASLNPKDLISQC